MTELPPTFDALAALAFVLGLRHGFDADHLATIDALTRLHGCGASRAARWCGSLFSLGHGAVVLAVALLLWALQARWNAQGQVPGWLQPVGTAISLTFLLGLGVANLKALLSTPADQVLQPVGLRSGWLGGLQKVRHPLAVAGIGALFALSFDTLGQAAFFALAGGAQGGAHVAALALLFLAGMLVTDGLNGWWVSQLLRRADARAARASRWMSAAVVVVSLGVAALGLARWLSPPLDAWAEPRGSLFSAVVAGVVLGSYALARWLARRAPPAWS